MSVRKTDEWTDTLEEAFGPNGKIGSAGERLACRTYIQLGYEIDYRPSDRKTQLAGIDLFIRENGFDWQSIDIKTNLHDDKTEVAVDWKIIEKSQATFLAHFKQKDVNKRYTKDFIMYKREKMKKYIEQNQSKLKFTDTTGPVYWVKKEVASTLV